MTQPASIPINPAFAKSIAWMHEPVHLSCAFLPWFLVRLIESALHSYLCRAEQCLLMLWQLKEQGKLEPWPDAVDERPAQRRSKYKMKFPPAAPTRCAGAKPVQMAAEAMPVAGAGADAGAAKHAAKAVFWGWLPALPRQRKMCLGAAVVRLPDRCRPAWVCGAAEMRRIICV